VVAAAAAAQTTFTTTTGGDRALHSLVYAEDTTAPQHQAATHSAPAMLVGAAGPAAAHHQFGCSDEVLCTIREDGRPRSRSVSGGVYQQPKLAAQHQYQSDSDDDDEEEGGEPAFLRHFDAAAAASAFQHRSADHHQQGGAAASYHIQMHAGSIHQHMLRAIRDVRRSSSDCAARVAALSNLPSSSFSTPRGRTSSATGPSPPVLRHPPQRRFSISRAKSVLAECAVGAADRGGLVACETGVLSPLLARIRADGVVLDADGGVLNRSDTYTSNVDGSCTGGGDGSVVGRGRSCDLWPASRRCSVDAAGVQGNGGSHSYIRRSADTITPIDAAAVEREEVPIEQQQQQRLLDCLETVSYLAVDDTNRSALVNMGAPQLLASKFTAAAMVAGLAPGHAATPSAATAAAPAAAHGGAAISNTPLPASQAVGAAALRALVGLLRGDSLKREFWSSDSGAVLLAVLSTATRSGELVNAAFSAAASLAWSAAQSGGSSSFDALSYLSSDLYGTATPRGGSTTAVQLLEPRLVQSLAGSSALHPRANPAVTLAALRLLVLAQQRQSPPVKAAQRSTSDTSGGSAPPSPTSCGGSIEEQPRDAASKAQACGWRTAAFSLVPLLMEAAHPSSPPAPAPHRTASGTTPTSATSTNPTGPEHERQFTAAVATALDLIHCMSHTPELAAAVCAAGTLAPLLALLIESGAANGGSGSTTARIAAIIAALARRGGRSVLARLREGAALGALLRAVADPGTSPSTKVVLLCVLCQAADDDSGGEAQRLAAVEALRSQGAVQAVRLLLVKEAARHDELQRRAQDLLSALGSCRSEVLDAPAPAG